MANPRYAKPAGCSGCSLEHNGFGFAPVVGPASTRLLFVGEALGYEEGVAGEPFYGAAGGTLSRLLHRAGITRAHVRIANIVSCRPPQDWLDSAPWETHAIQQCRQYLQPVIDQLPDDGVIVPLGATALRSILGLHGVEGVAVKDFHGTVSRSPDNRHWVVPNFHPSHLQRGAMNLLDVCSEDMKTADRISREGFVRSPFQLVVDPPIEWFRSWVTAHIARAQGDPDGVWLALDTEFEGKPDDESEVHGARGVRLTRVNLASDTTTGITVPYVGDFIVEVERLLAALHAIRGIVLLFNKYADWEPLHAAGHTIADIEAYDLMWLWHHIHSDLPRGLGFVAPMASDFGAWKHWSKVREKQGLYAAADGLQTFRVGVWLIRAAIQLGMWEMFVRDWHERDRYVLRPSHVVGVPINRAELQEFHDENQRKLARVLERMKTTAAAGVLKPKKGYSKRPSVTCAVCHGDGDVMISGDGIEIHPCSTCAGTGKVAATTPPASIMGKPKAGGAEAKTAYMHEGVTLVERTIIVEVRCCETCGAEDVGPRHKCPLPPAPKRKAAKSRGRGVILDSVQHVAGVSGVVAPDGSAAPDRVRPTAVLVVRAVPQPRWFWQLPFNPDAAAQILAYIESRGIDAPVNKKSIGKDGKPKKTTNKQALKKLAKENQDDPFFQLQLDWKAVQKVDATYAVGTLRRLDDDDRVHPEYLPKPSTLRDSAINPNLTNVVADKAGPDGLASGFRRCIEARDGLPPGVTDTDYQAWERRWAN